MKKNRILTPLNNTLGRYKQSVSSSDKEKITGYVFIILTLVTVSFFGLFAIKPTLATIANLNKQYEDNMIIYDALTQKLENLKALDSQYATIQPDLPLIYNAIPESARIPKLTRQLEDLANTSGVILNGLDFGTVEIFPNVKNEIIYSFTFAAAVEGTQENVNRFLSSLISFDRIIGINRISTGTNEDNRYRAEITGRAYFAK